MRPNNIINELFAAVYFLVNDSPATKTVREKIISTLYLHLVSFLAHRDKSQEQQTNRILTPENNFPSIKTLALRVQKWRRKLEKQEHRFSLFLNANSWRNIWNGEPQLEYSEKLSLVSVYLLLLCINFILKELTCNNLSELLPLFTLILTLHLFSIAPTDGVG